MSIGDILPDFVLKDQNSNEFHLYDIRDKLVLLSFHPLAWTSVCAKQMQALEDSYRTLEDLGVVAVGISIDSVPTKKAWAEDLGIKETSLLSDFWPHGSIAQKLGLFIEEKGISKRANVLLSKNKEILFWKVYELSELPDLNEIIDFVRNTK